MTGQYHTKNGKTGKRGAFISSIWHCDCEPRMPAEKFQTKNGGKNHGRWFYTCQKPQPRRCGFFLWQDDAKVREEAALLGNSKTEPDALSLPQTPHKFRTLAEPLTPYSRVKTNTNETEAHSKGKDDDSQGTVDEDFGWNSSEDEQLVAMTEDSPRKSVKTTHVQTPGQRKHDEDAFQTPSTSSKLTGLMSPINTTSRPAKTPNSASGTGGIVTEVLEVLKPANISNTIEEELVQLLNRYELRAQGIAKGRDITRLAVQSKDKKIAELQSRISSLEADRETSRTVIAHLKQDIATSPKRPRRPQPPSRSEG